MRATRSKAGTLYLVHVLTHATRSRLDDLLSDLQLTAFQYTVLSVIERNEGLSSSRLSRRFHVTPQAMGDTILALERKELIARKEDKANRRILRLSLTEKGMESFHIGRNLVAAFERDVFAGHSASELAALRTMISDALSRLREDA